MRRASARVKKAQIKAEEEKRAFLLSIFMHFEQALAHDQAGT